MMVGMAQRAVLTLLCIVLLTQDNNLSEAFSLQIPTRIPSPLLSRGNVCKRPKISSGISSLRATGTVPPPPKEDTLSDAEGHIAQVHVTEDLAMFKKTGTSALKVVQVDKSSLLDDILGFLFQIGGKLIFPNDDAVLAIGHLNDLIGDQPLFIPLAIYGEKYGGVYKLSFAPVHQATFYVVSEPTAVKHIMKQRVFDFDKGLLAEILDPILGKGLIPADIETWRKRRPVVQPGFHTRWLERMCQDFNKCAKVLVEKLEEASSVDQAVDMEGLFNSVSLDIIGKAVFNYDFGSVTSKSPVILAAYACLKEAEHRSTFILPYWNIPVIGSGPYSIIPRQREFAHHLNVLNSKLDEMVALARQMKNEGDLEMLEKRDYQSMQDPSLLRFLVDLRGGDCDDKQLRDDLMTMLVAGHETTGSLLTWTLFELMQNPEEMKKVQDEMAAVLGDRDATMEDIKNLHYLKLCLAESLRLYPQPPIVIRRALKEGELPLAQAGKLADDAGGNGMQEKTVKLGVGANIFISVWNLHRNPKIWQDPDAYKPSRWLSKQAPLHLLSGWEGYTPRDPPGMYPNEVDSDFGFIPFGGGQRKCVGDQFAMMEAVIIMTHVLRNFDLKLVSKPEDVGMSTGATIHTKKGLFVRAKARNKDWTEI